MSVFTSRVTATISLPHVPGQTVTIRKLAPKQLEAARAAQIEATYDDLKRQIEITQALGDEVIKAIGGTARTDAAAPAADPLVLYDQNVLAKKAVLAWTFPEKVTPEAIDDLDEETLEVIARAVLRLTKPALFQTEAEAETATKNG